MQVTKLTPRALAPGMEEICVRDLMTTNPVSVRHNATVREAAAFLDARQIGGAPVVNDAGRAIGVLSQFDILLAINAGLEGAPVREVMTPSIFVVRPHTQALDAVEHMVRQMVRRVFVVDDEGILIGVVSMSDLCRGLAAVWSAPAVDWEVRDTEEYQR